MSSQTTLNALLVDDEQLALDNLGKMLELYCPAIKVVGLADTLEMAAIKAKELAPDVIFLDINIHGHNGFDLIPLLEHKPMVVFVTAYEKYLLQALRISAVDYLLKPIDLQELLQTEKRLIEFIELKRNQSELYQQNLKQVGSINTEKIPISRITIPNANGYESFELAQLAFIKGSDNYSIFSFKGKPEKVVARTLKEYEEMLKDHGFMRVHKSYLVQLSHVQSLSKKDAMELILQDGNRIPVSRRKSADVLDWFKKDGQTRN